MGFLAIAREESVRATATGVNATSSKFSCRLVVLSCLLLFGGSLARKSRDINTDFWYVNCEQKETSLIANGVCDMSLNTADCGFDGGDCCECTCGSLDGSPCDREDLRFSCRDPQALIDCPSTGIPTRIVSATSSYPECAGHPTHIKDGRCDDSNNNADCGFDGGDCCAGTCASGLEFACGDGDGLGFDCRDPSVTPVHRRLTSSSSCGGDTDDIGNTECDSSLNNEECGYDGGDCCECTCVPPLDQFGQELEYITNHCSVEGNYDCLDPDANCETGGESPTPDPTPGPMYVDPTPTPIYVYPTPSPVYVYPTPTPIDVRPVASPTGSPAPGSTVGIVPTPTLNPSPSSGSTSSECGWSDSYLGDGECDSVTNTLECGWDGGDCCECTCEETYYYKCPVFDCLDPSAPTDCGSDTSGTSPSSSATVAPSPTTPTESPVAAPIASPVAASTQSPVTAPIASPSAGPTARPVASPIASPEAAPITPSTSSAQLTATTRAFVVHLEVVAALSASFVLGYCFL